MQQQQQEQLYNTSEDSLILFKLYINGIQYSASMDHRKLTVHNVQIIVYDMIGLVKKQMIAEGEQNYTLYHYPRRKKRFRAEQRYVEQFNFNIKNQNLWERTWQAIICRINNRLPGQSLKLLICYNPNAGSNSKSHLTNILNFLKYTNLTPEILSTNHRNHCLQHLKTINKKQYCGIAIVSGDGLMHQYVNSFCQVPVTHVPAGSGNAFAKTQMTHAGELCKDQESIFLVVKNRRKKFNIVKYELEKVAQPIYSFLSLQWALIADLDMNSQFLRCLGGLRFQVYAVWRLIKLKRYRGKLTYSTIQQKMPSFATDLQTNPNYITIQDTFLHTIFCTIPYISQKHKIAPLIKLDQKYIDMQYITQNAGRMQLAKYLISSDSGSQFNIQEQRANEGYNFKHAKIKSFRLEPLNANEMGIFGIDGQAYEAQRIQASFCDQTFQAFV